VCVLSATAGLGVCLAAILEAVGALPSGESSARWLLLAFNFSTLMAVTCLCMLLLEHRRRALRGAPGRPVSPWLWIPALAAIAGSAQAAAEACGLSADIGIMLAAEAGVLAAVACALWSRTPIASAAASRAEPPGAGALAAVLNCSSDGLMTAGLDGSVTGWNPAAENMLGWKNCEAIGRSNVWAPPPERMGEECALLERMRAGGRVERYETQLKRKDGRTLEVAVTVSPIFDDHGSPVGVVRAVRDLTLAEDRKERHRRRQAELAHLSRIHAINDLSAAVAHEINQPLAAIGNLLGVARKIIDHGADNPGVNDLRAAGGAVGLAAEQAVRAGEIISHVRAFMAHGEVDVRAERLDHIVERALTLAMLTDGSQTLVHKSLAPNLLVWADRIQIEQVIVNLVKNAIEAMRDLPAHKRRLTVTAGLSADPESAEVCIVDTGPGLQADRVDQSKPFVSNKTGGLGIGLSISRRIIVAHGGRLSGMSGTVGAQFRFTIPIAREGWGGA
jgi:two-component system sensor kinase FixL